MLDCSKETDNNIINFIRSWDIDAFYCIVEKYEEKLLKYILRITNIDVEDAENLLQEVFIKVYKNVNEFNEKLSFLSWIYRVTHNITIDHYRKTKDKNNLSLYSQDDEVWNLIEILEHPVNIEDEYKKKELVNKIFETLNKLDNKYKEILVLKFIEEKNYTEISDILRIPEWTVATLINRWKKQFKQIAEENNFNFYI